jgi:hypothetical protein
MNRMLLIGALSLSSVSFGADFLCQGAGQSAFAPKTISFDLNKSEIKELVKFNGITASVALDASNHDGQPYLSIETMSVDVNSGVFASMTAKGPIVKDMVVILHALDSKNGEISIVCSPF